MTPTCREDDHGEHQRQFREFCDPDADPVGADHVTLSVPNTKPAPKTIAKYTADDVNSFMDVFESRIAA